MVERIRLCPPHDSHPTTILDVRISKLVTPQLSVNIARAEKRANVKPKMTKDELFDLAFQSSGESDPINRQILGLGQFNGAVLFTSYDEDIRLHHPPEYRRLLKSEKDKGSPSLENVCFPVGGGYPFATAFKVEITQNISRRRPSGFRFKSDLDLNPRSKITGTPVPGFELLKVEAGFEPRTPGDALAAPLLVPRSGR
jgi:hypothetical protein